MYYNTREFGQLKSDAKCAFYNNLIPKTASVQGTLFNIIDRLSHISCDLILVRSEMANNFGLCSGHEVEDILTSMKFYTGATLPPFSQDIKLHHL